MPLKVGDTAPDFSLMDPNRQTVSLSDFKGQKAVVLAFYPMAFTPGCTLEMCTFRDINTEFESAGAQVLGVSADTFASQGGFGREISANFPLLSDWPKFETSKAYGVLRDGINVTTRVTYIIDKEGVIRGVIESETDMVVHSADALRLVKELG